MSPARKIRGRPVRPHPSFLFLLLGIALLLVVAYQAHTAARQQSATVGRVLDSYAGVAVWNLEQQFRAQIASSLEAVFHPVHFSHGGRGAAPVPVSRLLEGRGEVGDCARELIDGTIAAFRFALRGDAADAWLRPDAGVPAATVRARVARHLRAEDPRGRAAPAEGVFADTIAGEPRLVLYSARAAAGDSIVYALVLDAAGTTAFFDRVRTAGPLLPPTLLEDTRPDEILTVALQTPSGAPLYSTGRRGDYSASAVFERMGGLTGVVRIHESATQHLILGGEPSSRLVLLLGLLALAIGLVIVAFGQLRREHALARLRSDFVSSVSHELRTPLALQRIFLDTLRLERATDAARRDWCLDGIDRESLRLAHLVENVLQFSRAEQGTIKVASTPTTLAPLLTEIVDAFRPLAQPGGVTLTTDLAGGIEAPVDPAAFRQVLLNLLENAVRYGPEGQRVSVRLRLAGTVARITVDDEGPGIPVAERRAIFEPFRRGRSSAESATAGSGIGLAVVREIVRLHGGTVQVGDAPAGGARFTVELPGARLLPDATPDRSGARGVPAIDPPGTIATQGAATAVFAAPPAAATLPAGAPAREPQRA